MTRITSHSPATARTLKEPQSLTRRRPRCGQVLDTECQGRRALPAAASQGSVCAIAQSENLSLAIVLSYGSSPRTSSRARLGSGAESALIRELDMGRAVASQRTVSGKPTRVVVLQARSRGRGSAAHHG